ncbi:MAG TPA: sugar phosphate isomerase/epimerase family protein [Limnochordia bacterium]
MIPCLTTAGIGNPGGIEALVALAGRHGFQAIDTGGEALERWVAARGVDGVKESLAAHGVRLGAIGLPVEWRRDEATFRQGLPRLAAHAHLASQLGGTVCCTWMPPSIDEPVAVFASRAIRRFRACADILGDFGMRLGLEFVGPHHLRRRSHLFVYDLPGTLELIAAIDLPNVGILLDSYHWHTTEATVADIEALPRGAVVHVHINDAKPLPRAELLDNDRLFPGEGAIDLRGFCGALRRIAYDGCIALEVLSQSPPPGSVDEAAARAKRGIDAALAGV